MLDEGVYRVIYASRAAEGVTEDVVHDILATSVRKNRLHSITGMLIFDGGQFWEALEGPEVAVMTACAHIFADPRHTDIDVLSEGRVYDRKFAKFALGFPKNVPSAIVQRATSSVGPMIGGATRSAAAASAELLDLYGPNGRLRGALRDR